MRLRRLCSRCKKGAVRQHLLLHGRSLGVESLPLGSALLRLICWLHSSTEAFSGSPRILLLSKLHWRRWATIIRLPLFLPSFFGWCESVSCGVSKKIRNGFTLVRVDDGYMDKAIKEITSRIERFERAVFGSARQSVRVQESSPNFTGATGGIHFLISRKFF